MSEINKDGKQALSLDALSQVNGGQSIPSSRSILDTMASNMKREGATLEETVDSVSKINFNSPLYSDMDSESAARYVQTKWSKY